MLTLKLQWSLANIVSRTIRIACSWCEQNRKGRKKNRQNVLLTLSAAEFYLKGVWHENPLWCMVVWVLSWLWAGADHFSECVDLVQEHKLYVEALKLFSTDSFEFKVGTTWISLHCLLFAALSVSVSVSGKGRRGGREEIDEGKVKERGGRKEGGGGRKGREGGRKEEEGGERGEGGRKEEEGGEEGEGGRKKKEGK